MARVQWRGVTVDDAEYLSVPSLLRDQPLQVHLPAGRGGHQHPLHLADPGAVEHIGDPGFGRDSHVHALGTLQQHHAQQRRRRTHAYPVPQRTWIGKAHTNLDRGRGRWCPEMEVDKR